MNSIACLLSVFINSFFLNLVSLFIKEFYLYFYFNITVYFLLEDWRHTCRRNPIEISTVYFFGFFQTDVLINFFIPLRQAEAFTWEILVQAKKDPSCTKEWSCLAGMKVYVVARYNLWVFLTLPWNQAKRERISFRPTGTMESPPKRPTISEFQK